MGWDYALVHLIYTIPPALLLTVILRPFLTRIDVYKICFLLTVAVIYTIPWDSYLVRHAIWTYPHHAVLGPTIWAIPLEELFFFFIQTYNTSLIYILFNKSTLFPIYLKDNSQESATSIRSSKFWRQAGQVGLFAGILYSAHLSIQGEKGTYLGLICLWALPVLLLLWSLAYQVIICLPLAKCVVPIALPTLYLWVIDTLSLHRGTWAISSNTKLSIFLWPHLEIEEAFFFLATNTLIVWGLCAFDNALAILDTSDRFTEYSSIKLPPPTTLIQVLLAPTSTYDVELTKGLSEALHTLQRKSRSFFLASSTFSGPLRIDLVLLYSYCRVADDLVDNAQTADEARDWISRLHALLSFAYSEDTVQSPGRLRHRFLGATDILEAFPESSRVILRLLPFSELPPQPLYDLLAGFETDLKFSSSEPPVTYPITNASDLENYASCVASTVAELCLSLSYFHHPPSSGKRRGKKEYCLQAGKKMGLALQYINIARDVATDAGLGRCYLPTSWLMEEGLTPEEVIRCQGTALGVDKVRKRLLEIAIGIYEENVNAIEDLPLEVRDGFRVAVESYVEIGRVLRKKLGQQNSMPTTYSNGNKSRSAGGQSRNSRATVPRLQRLYVAWKVMSGPQNR